MLMELATTTRRTGRSISFWNSTAVPSSLTLV
jgi:hypothetical protein